MMTHKMSTELNFPWPLMNKNVLESIGLSPQDDVEKIHKVAFEKLKENFYQKSFEETSSEHSKLRTYAKLNAEIGIEKYMG